MGQKVTYDCKIGIEHSAGGSGKDWLKHRFTKRSEWENADQKRFGLDKYRWRKGVMEQMKRRGLVDKSREQRVRKKLWKQIVACASCLCLCASQSLTALAAAWEKVGGIYQMEDGTPINGAIARGIDVSHWQQEIDWEQVRQDDVEFVMLGTRYKGAVDPNFRVNAQRAHAAGIKLGAYIYSYATSVEMAEQEADFVLDLIKDYPISYPVAFDAEDSGTLGTLSPSQVSDIINAFCRKIQAAGYHPMVYANEYWLNNKIDLSKLNYDVWVARYNVMYTYDSPSMWQATSTGSVNGIKGNVDIDLLFTDHTRNLPGDLWRTIGGNTYYYKDHSMQKETWIDDGTGWFYLDGIGSPVKGWMSMPEGWYHLDEDTGRMSTGWKSVDGSWYYLRENGRMVTGWRQVDGSWYYLADDGRMQTGWQDIGGQRYHLSGSGAMDTGWQQLDGARYHFQPSGEMSKGWASVDGSWYYMADNGMMQTGWQEIGGSRYHLAEDGRMQTGWQSIDGAWYYMSSSGAMQTGWQNINGTWYYLDSSGVMQTGWQNINGTWYYMNSSGAMLTGWQEINGALYYLDGSGAMAANAELERDGARYRADGSGACTPVPVEEGTTAGAGTMADAGAPAGTGTPAGAGMSAEAIAAGPGGV